MKQSATTDMPAWEEWVKTNKCSIDTLLTAHLPRLLQADEPDTKRVGIEIFESLGANDYFSRSSLQALANWPDDAVSALDDILNSRLEKLILSGHTLEIFNSGLSEQIQLKSLGFLGGTEAITKLHHWVYHDNSDETYTRKWFESPYLNVLSGIILHEGPLAVRLAAIDLFTRPDIVEVLEHKCPDNISISSLEVISRLNPYSLVLSTIFESKRGQPQEVRTRALEKINYNIQQNIGRLFIRAFLGSADESAQLIVVSLLGSRVAIENLNHPFFWKDYFVTALTSQHTAVQEAAYGLLKRDDVTHKLTQDQLFEILESGLGDLDMGKLSKVQRTVIDLLSEPSVQGRLAPASMAKLQEKIVRTARLGRAVEARGFHALS